MKHEGWPTEDAEFFMALGHSRRLVLYNRIAGRKDGDPGVTATVLSALHGIPPSTLQHHLAILRHAGLIEEKRVGKEVRFTVSQEGREALLGAVERLDICACGEKVER